MIFYLLIDLSNSQNTVGHPVLSGKFDGSLINKHQNTGLTKFSCMLNMKLHTMKSKQKKFSRFKTVSSSWKIPHPYNRNQINIGNISVV